MQPRLFRGFTALSGHLKEMRWKLIKKASIFGDPLAEGSQQDHAKGEVVRKSDGAGVLTILLTKEQGIPETMQVEDKVFSITEVGKDAEKDPEEKRFEVISKRLSKPANRLIGRFGMNIALWVARLNSRLDIFTSEFVLCMELAATALIVYGIATAILKGNAEDIVQKFREDAESTQLLVDIGIIGVIGTAAFVAFAWFKQFLDDTQQILVNHVKIRMHKLHSEKYKDFLKLEEKYTETEIGNAEDSFFYAMVQKIPILGAITRHVFDELYNIRLELREIAALKDMGRFIFLLDAEKKESHRASPPL